MTEVGQKVQQLVVVLERLKADEMVFLLALMKATAKVVRWAAVKAAQMAAVRAESMGLQKG